MSKNARTGLDAVSAYQNPANMLELISVHLPKSAGTSFRKVLQRHFGWRLLKLYGEFGSPAAFQKKLDRRPWVRAVHGHFPVKAFHETAPRAKTVIWLRHPVERIISYYYFWKQLRPHGNPVHNRFLADTPTLPDFARQRRMEIHDYLAGYRLEDFDFVGTVTCFEEDILRFETWLKNESIRRYADPLSLLLRIRNAMTERPPHANRTQRQKGEGEKIRKELAQILEDEMQLYEQALNAHSMRP